MRAGDFGDFAIIRADHNAGKETALSCPIERMGNQRLASEVTDIFAWDTL